jgi:glycosyltransferase involved in cell wall biosynthesis
MSCKNKNKTEIKKMKLSIGIITFNEEKILGRTLDSVKGIADEIIIVDSNSTDSTVEIAKSFGAKVFSEDWKGFGVQKNSVLDKCNGEWILLLDADEVISTELAEKIDYIISNDSKYSVFKINLCCICFGKELKYGGWSNDYHIRLWKNGTVRYNDNLVHEGFITNEDVGKIREKIFHYSYLTLQDYFDKFNKYTTLGSKEYYKRNKKAGLFNLTLNPLFKFIRMYFIRCGFLDGIEGFMMACASSMYTMVKYFKLREMYKNNSYSE